MNKHTAQMIGALTDTDPRHVYAWMLDKLGTLDGVMDFDREVTAAAKVARQAGPDLSEQLAQSYGV